MVTQQELQQRQRILRGSRIAPITRPQPVEVVRPKLTDRDLKREATALRQQERAVSKLTEKLQSIGSRTPQRRVTITKALKNAKQELAATRARLDRQGTRRVVEARKPRDFNRGRLSEPRSKAVAQRERFLIEQRRAQLPRAPTGVFAGGKGEQVIVTEGTAPTSAEQLVRRLEKAELQRPVPQRNPALLRGKLVGVQKDGIIDAGPGRLVVEEFTDGKRTGTKVLRRFRIQQKGDTGRTRSDTVLDNVTRDRIPSNTVVSQVLTELASESPQRSGKISRAVSSYVGSAKEFLGAVVRGTAKAESKFLRVKEESKTPLSFIPAFERFREKRKQQLFLSPSKPLLSDPDVQTAAVTGGAGLFFSAIPSAIAQPLIIGSSLGTGIGTFAAKPTPEQFGKSAFIATPAVFAGKNLRVTRKASVANRQFAGKSISPEQGKQLPPGTEVVGREILGQQRKGIGEVNVRSGVGVAQVTETPLFGPKRTATPQEFLPSRVRVDRARVGVIEESPASALTPGLPARQGVTGFTGVFRDSFIRSARQFTQFVGQKGQKRVRILTRDPNEGLAGVPLAPGSLGRTGARRASGIVRVGVGVSERFFPLPPPPPTSAGGILGGTSRGRPFGTKFVFAPAGLLRGGRLRIPQQFTEGVFIDKGKGTFLAVQRTVRDTSLPFGVGKGLQRTSTLFGRIKDVGQTFLFPKPLQTFIQEAGRKPVRLPFFVEKVRPSTKTRTTTGVSAGAAASSVDGTQSGQVLVSLLKPPETNAITGAATRQQTQQTSVGAQQTAPPSTRQENTFVQTFKSRAQFDLGRTLGRQAARSRLGQQQRFLTATRTRTAQRTIQEPVQKTRTKTVQDIAFIQKQATRQQTVQKQRQLLRTIQAQELLTRQRTRQRTGLRQRPRPLPPPRRPKPELLARLSRAKPERGESPAFAAFIKRRGEFVLLGKGLTKRQALTLGSTSARRSLAATFRVTPTGGTVRQPISRARPNLSGFREFRRVKGKRVRTPGTFIQKRGTLLGTLQERRRIQAARRRRRI